MTAMKLFHSRTQHAVGQGGFHTACVETGDRAMHYVYDCGSTSIGQLSSAIDEFANSTGNVDLFFLSHLDQDHANGADMLMDRVAVATVVLPYVSPFERVVLAAEFLAEGGGAVGFRTLTEMLARPARWFLDRGASQVVFVGPPGDDFAPLRPAQADEHPPATETLDLEIPSQPLDAGVKSQVGAGARDDVVVMRPGPISIRSGKTTIWTLAPYVHPEPFKAPAFQAAVAQLLGFRKRGGPALDDIRWGKELKTFVADRVRRRMLAELYNRFIRRDRNLSSMTLYSGPTLRDGVKAKLLMNRSRSWSWHISPAIGRPAWIGTGDAHLDRRNRRAAFERFHANLVATVGTIMLPHHGSRHNLKPSFVYDHEGVAWVAAYGTRNKYRHPDPYLMHLAETLGHAVAVTEKPRTRFVQTVLLEW